jgi:hypothetical protein
VCSSSEAGRFSLLSAPLLVRYSIAGFLLAPYIPVGIYLWKRPSRSSNSFFKSSLIHANTTIALKLCCRPHEYCVCWGRGFMKVLPVCWLSLYEKGTKMSSYIFLLFGSGEKRHNKFAILN